MDNYSFHIRLLILLKLIFAFRVVYYITCSLSERLQWVISRTLTDG